MNKSNYNRKKKTLNILIYCTHKDETPLKTFQIENNG